MAARAENDGPVTQDDISRSTSRLPDRLTRNLQSTLQDICSTPWVSPVVHGFPARASGRAAPTLRFIAEGFWQARIDIPLEPAAAALGETRYPRNGGFC